MFLSGGMALDLPKSGKIGYIRKDRVSGIHVVVIVEYEHIESGYITTTKRVVYEGLLTTSSETDKVEAEHPFFVVLSYIKNGDKVFVDPRTALAANSDLDLLRELDCIVAWFLEKDIFLLCAIFRFYCLWFRIPTKEPWSEDGILRNDPIIAWLNDIRQTLGYIL